MRPCVQTGMLVPAAKLIVSNLEFYAEKHLKIKHEELTGPINFAAQDIFYDRQFHS